MIAIVNNGLAVMVVISIMMMFIVIKIMIKMMSLTDIEDGSLNVGITSLIKSTMILSREDLEDDKMKVKDL